MSASVNTQDLMRAQLTATWDDVETKFAQLQRQDTVSETLIFVCCLNDSLRRLRALVHTFVCIANDAQASGLKDALVYLDYAVDTVTHVIVAEGRTEVMKRLCDRTFDLAKNGYHITDVFGI